jgi:hypothetical protein
LAAFGGCASLKNVSQLVMNPHPDWHSEGEHNKGLC